MRAVHITRSEVPDIALETIKDVMEEYDAIFTTSYDLLAYWGMGFYEDFGRLVDLFWSDGPDGKCEFNLAHTRVFPNHAPVYFLHGAMHLIVGGSGRTRKLIRTDETILDQFGQPIEGDPQGRPLLISEGSDRREAAGHRKQRLPLLRARPPDQLRLAAGHLWQCPRGAGHAPDPLINETPTRPVAVSMRPSRSGAKTAMAKQAEIRSRLRAHELHFYNAETYPLGESDLACRPSPGRRLVGSLA